MKTFIKNEKGVALMLVLSSVLILTTIVVEFAFNSHVSYELASSERDRLKAYYLARSGLNLARLELKLEKDLRVRFASLLQNLPGNSVPSDPLCKQVPLSTGLLKGISSGEITESAKSFLNFDGDFDVSCDTEERKVNLNVFRTDPGTSSTSDTLSLYDSQKSLLFSLLSGKEFEAIFKGKPDEIRKVVNAIADWADRDDRINEAPGISGGSEEALYMGPDYHYKPKNGKYTSVAELLLVAGVGDDIYKKLSPQITIYGDHRIHICQASEELVKAFISRFAMTSLGIAPISPTDNSKWTAIRKTIHLACNQASPQITSIANAIGGFLGLSDSRGLASQITTTNRFYRIEANGSVNDSKVRLTTVIDAGQASPNLWKTLYFRVE